MRPSMLVMRPPSEVPRNAAMAMIVPITAAVCLVSLVIVAFRACGRPVGPSGSSLVVTAYSAVGLWLAKTLAVRACCGTVWSLARRL